MKHINHGTSDLVESEESFSLQIIEQKPSNDFGSFAVFEPQAKTSSASSCYVEELTAPAPTKKLALFAILLAPEKKLSVLAIRLSILEKAATSLGVLGFIWASVVLLGGFVGTLQESDFWFVTTILVIEGARIFSRSHELKWQHMANWSLADAGINEFSTLKLSSYLIIRKVKAVLNLSSETQLQLDERLENNDTEKPDNGNDQKMLSQTEDVPFYRVFLSKNASKIFSWLQVSSAMVCVVLSLIKLIKQNFGEINDDNPSLKKNRISSLNIFYALAIAEAMLLLWRKAYWEWQVTYCKLMEEVKKECELGPNGIIPVRKFFFDTYSTCINGSIFDGLKLDMASFGIDLMISDLYDEQLVGARILQKFSTNERFSSDTLRKIGISAAAMERLVEMLNWKDPEEEEIRLSAAEILSKLAEKRQTSLRIAAIPGSMESISSLLHISNNCSRIAPEEEVNEKENAYVQEKYEYSTLNHLGLLILKKLAQNHDTCGKIGKTRGILPRIINFTDPGEQLRIDGTMTKSQALAMKRSLKLLKTLVRTTGTTGELLCQRISENVFTISNLREILCYGGKHVKLQILGMQILTSLALEDDAKERIGSTGGILKELLVIFFNQGRPETQDTVRVIAGAALAMLAFESERNCHRILKLNVVEKLIKSLEDRVLHKGSARILINLCAQAGPDCIKQINGVTAAAISVLRAIMTEQNKLQELMLGLATQVFRFMTPQESSDVFKQTGVEEIDLAMKLVEILQHNRYPSVKVPRIRRFTIELVIWMMRSEQSHIYVFKELGMEQELENVMETTSELESFNNFSSSIGQNRYRITMQSLINEALELLCNG